ncbi:MAG: phosphotransferase [Oscillospiraceae bacterium]|nr:phosphotransferase [Oscillospiraceae bacterium]
MEIIDVSSITQSESFCNWLNIGLGDWVDFKLLGHGEYNVNYTFPCPKTGALLVLRVPMGSQMHLANQVRYEYEALELLKPSGRTPTPLFIDDTKTAMPYGFLVMNFLPGRPLRYESDLPAAAACLADIHNLDVPDGHALISPANPLGAILDECHAMVTHFFDSERAAPEIKKMISSLLEYGNEILQCDRSCNGRCLVNTELNSGNFLVNESHITYLVDWEKPLFASPGQDLGHFLAPTTTLWKTETVLSMAEIMHFIELYCKTSVRYNDPSLLWETTSPYLKMNCLRGITWCAMAWVEYQSPERILKDDYTFEKIKQYITSEFLEKIRMEYFSE